MHTTQSEPLPGGSNARRKTRAAIVPTTVILQPFVEEVQAALAPLANAHQAERMAAYMKNHFIFLGVPTPQRRQATTVLLPLLAEASAEQLLAQAWALWALPHREYQYVALDILARYQQRLQPVHLAALLDLAQSCAWWDSVDCLAATAGQLLRRHQGMLPTGVYPMDLAIGHASHWVRRIAMLHQLGWRDATDVPRLFNYARQLAPESNFFLRKSIGWALRDFAKHDAVTVTDFLLQMKPQFSALTYREACRYLRL